MSSVDSPFQVPPFPSFPSLERYVPVGSQDEALVRVRRAIDAWEAISLVIGPPGTGKSLIVQMLASQFAKSREVVVIGDATIDSPAALQRYLLRRLTRTKGIEASPAAIDDLQLTLIDRIESCTSEFPGLLLLVDEAQSLSPEVLETIRVLTNVMKSSRPLVSAVLLGGPRLDETLALPMLESLVQRVATRCYLHPLHVDETVHYVRQVIENCGSDPAATIDESALRSIHRACGGVPRLVNQLMTAAIDSAAALGQSLITRNIVDHAWSVLQQLPSPMVLEAKMSSVHAVEFGPLDAGQAPSNPKSDSPKTDKPKTAPTPSSPPVAATPSQPKPPTIAPSTVAPPTVVPPTPKPISLENFIAQTQFSESAMSPDLSSMSIDCSSCDVRDAVPSHDDALMIQRTPSRDTLFGNFEVEESVELSASHPLTPSAQSLKNLRPIAPTENALEKSLHEEVLSLRGAASARLKMVDVNDDDDDETFDPQPAPRRVAAPLLWLADDETSGPRAHDDSDILVIEDDVPIDGAEMVHAAAPSAPGVTVSVDFQSMLAKMRSSNREGSQ